MIDIMEKIFEENSIVHIEISRNLEGQNE
jgi:hypothetical protein